MDKTLVATGSGLYTVKSDGTCEPLELNHQIIDGFKGQNHAGNNNALASHFPIRIRENSVGHECYCDGFFPCAGESKTRINFGDGIHVYERDGLSHSQSPSLKAPFEIIPIPVVNSDDEWRFAAIGILVGVLASLPLWALIAWAAGWLS